MPKSRSRSRTYCVSHSDTEIQAAISWVTTIDRRLRAEADAADRIWREPTVREAAEVERAAAGMARDRERMAWWMGGRQTP